MCFQIILQYSEIYINTKLYKFEISVIVEKCYKFGVLFILVLSSFYGYCIDEFALFPDGVFLILICCLF